MRLEPVDLGALLGAAAGAVDAVASELETYGFHPLGDFQVTRHGEAVDAGPIRLMDDPVLPAYAELHPRGGPALRVRFVTPLSNGAILVTSSLDREPYAADPDAAVGAGGFVVLSVPAAGTRALLLRHERAVALARSEALPESGHSVGRFAYHRSRLETRRSS